MSAAAGFAPWAALDTLQRDARSNGFITPPPLVEVRLCIPDDQREHAADLPAWALHLPEGAPLPRMGEVLYLSSTSAWCVSMVIHERLSRDLTRIEVWLEHVGAARHHRAVGTALQ